MKWSGTVWLVLRKVDDNTFCSRAWLVLFLFQPTCICFDFINSTADLWESLGFVIKQYHVSWFSRKQACSYASLQSPFHSPLPQGFSKRTSFTACPRLNSWPTEKMQTKACTNNCHMSKWIFSGQQDGLMSSLKFRRNMIASAMPVNKSVYLVHTCDSVGMALNQSIR